MRRIEQVIRIITIAILGCSMLTLGQLHPAQAESVSVPSLTISQLKITSSNGQFVMLYNATDTTLDMSKYQLEYFNNYDVNKATSSRLIPLAGNLPPHEYYMVNDSELALCYKLTVNSVSLGLSTTAGLVEVLAVSQASAGSGISTNLIDYAGWSKTATSGAQTLPTNTNAFLLRQPVDALANPLVAVPGSGTWLAVQPDSSNACKLVTNTSAQTPVVTGLNQLLAATEPPYEIHEVVDTSNDSAAPTPSIPAADIGLMSPKINELLPNPTGSGNDDTDEFIEVYNPNAVSFDLTGFKLQTGVSSTHSYIFPSGTALKAKSFAAFYSSDTGISLSNTTSQAALLDPFGNALSTSDSYSSAKDGQSWVFANSKWQWSTKPTPSAANVVIKPVAKKSKSKTTSPTARKQTNSKASSSAKPANKKSTVSYGQANYEEPAATFPVHTATLALVGCLALLYVGYEYRADLANRFVELRRNIKTWRENR